MSLIPLRSHTLLLWFSLFATAASSALLSAGCSSSTDAGAAGSAGKSGSSAGGAPASAGSDGAEAGDPGTSGEPETPDEVGETDEPGAGGRAATSHVGSGGSSAGGKSATNGGSPGGGDGEETGEGGAGGAPEAEDPELVAAKARAVALIVGLGEKRACSNCHDETYQGSGFYPNLTPDIETGIGSWTDDEIKAAIREGKSNDGKTLCATMERYTFSDSELSDIVTYLKHLTPIKKKISGKCPSL